MIQVGDEKVTIQKGTFKIFKVDEDLWWTAKSDEVSGDSPLEHTGPTKEIAMVNLK